MKMPFEKRPKSLNEALTKEEIKKKSNEWLLKKYVLMKRNFGAIVNDDIKNVETEILSRMGRRMRNDGGEMSHSTHKTK